MSTPFTINEREQAAKALWEEQNPLEAFDRGWDKLDSGLRSVARHDVEAVLFAFLAARAGSSQEADQ